MYTNGIIIQKLTENAYKGIDGSGFSPDTGENWYFYNDAELSPRFEQFYDEHIGRTYYDMGPGNWVAACTDMNHIAEYIAESKKRGIDYRLLLCETYIPRPTMEPPALGRKLLGYDYAYACGDNYSAVYNEVPGVFPQFRLNENGLFDTEEEIRQYLAAREEFVRTHPPYTLEVGDFTVFRLWELYL